ncbi:MAG: DnaD domain protein [Ruminococcaceae bacterium]|jgi:DnaD/phage-associated family protein|nr:DnaD domain protein [Oscillospiraceae bacterium]
MSGYILRDQERDVSLPAQRLDKLIARADSDAALLYLFLVRASGGVTPQEIQKRLRWSELRLADAEHTLQQLGLLEGGAETIPEPAEERPAYTTGDIAALLEGDSGFAMLVRQTEEKLGKKLKTADLQILAGLYDDLGMPPDVIYLLVCHCVSRVERRFGPGRRPTLRQVEKEGYYWARQGLFDQESAARYLKDYDAKQEQMGAYLRAVQICDRRPVDSEERYIIQWIEKGYTPELVALAYDRTIFYKKELKWGYLNGILRRWETDGLRTPEDVERQERTPRSAREKKTGRPAGEKNDWMKRYIKR